MLLYVGDIPWVSPELKDTVLQHQAIVFSRYSPLPDPHFFIRGHAEAVQYCIARYLTETFFHGVKRMMSTLRSVGTNQLAPYPAYYEEVQEGRAELPSPPHMKCLKSITSNCTE
jgi:hypothetical protein